MVVIQTGSQKDADLLDIGLESHYKNAVDILSYCGEDTCYSYGLIVVLLLK